jgi:hypothetical protein
VVVSYSHLRCRSLLGHVPTQRKGSVGVWCAVRYASTSRAHSPPFSARSKHGGADEDGEDSDDESPDVPAKAYVDAESRFITCEGVEVHYKVAGGSLGECFLTSPPWRADKQKRLFGTHAQN